MPVNLSRYINHIIIDDDPDSIGPCIVTAATKLKLDVVSIATGKRVMDYATNLFPSGLDGKDCGPMPKVGQKWMLFSHGNEPPREVRVTKCPGIQEDLVVEVEHPRKPFSSLHIPLHSPLQPSANSPGHDSPSAC